jgi:hypothetical protein
MSNLFLQEGETLITLSRRDRWSLLVVMGLRKQCHMNFTYGLIKRRTVSPTRRPVAIRIVHRSNDMAVRVRGKERNYRALQV